MDDFTTEYSYSFSKADMRDSKGLPKKNYFYENPNNMDKNEGNLFMHFSAFNDGKQIYAYVVLCTQKLNDNMLWEA